MKAGGHFAARLFLGMEFDVLRRGEKGRFFGKFGAHNQNLTEISLISPYSFPVFSNFDVLLVQISEFSIMC